MAMTNFLGVYGHVAIDHILAVPHLPRPNSSISVVNRIHHYGGTGGNIARIAARLGVPTALASFVGEDFSGEYRSALERDGVDLEDLRSVPGYGTPTVWIFSDPKGNQTAVVDQGPMAHASKFALLTHAVESSRIVHLGTGRPEYYRRVAALAARHGKVIAFDPSQEIHYVYTATSFLDLLRRADYFFGNEGETLAALRFTHLRRPRDLLRHVDVVVRTLGKRGSEVTEADGTTKIPSLRPRRVVDVTGAGDAYRAGFYAGLHRGYDPVRCAVLGSSVASFVVEAAGTQTNIPTWNQTLRRASRSARF